MLILLFLTIFPVFYVFSSISIWVSVYILSIFFSSYLPLQWEESSLKHNQRCKLSTLSLPFKFTLSICLSLYIFIFPTVSLFPSLSLFPSYLFFFISLPLFHPLSLYLSSLLNLFISSKGVCMLFYFLYFLLFTITKRPGVNPKNYFDVKHINMM